MLGLTTISHSNENWGPNLSPVKLRRVFFIIRTINRRPRLRFSFSQPNVRTTWPYAAVSKNFIHLAPGSEFNNVFYGLFLFTSNTIKEEKYGEKV